MASKDTFPGHRVRVKFLHAGGSSDSSEIESCLQQTSRGRAAVGLNAAAKPTGSSISSKVQLETETDLWP